MLCDSQNRIYLHAHGFFEPDNQSSVRMATSFNTLRRWHGSAVLSIGLRPFFFGAALWAMVAMCVWIAALVGWISIPSAFDPITWHAHEFLFGYLSAVVAGFLLTAVPNWTGRLPIVGWPLASLFALWLVGRFAVLFSVYLHPVLVAIAALASMAALIGFLTREIIIGKNWRNAVLLVLLLVLLIANAVFHREFTELGYAADGVGIRLGLGCAILMITVIGGRIVPSFTRNWLVKQQQDQLPAQPGLVDRLTLLATAITVGLWVALPDRGVTGVMLIATGVLHLVRMARWRGLATWREPLVFVLHVGYACVPIGALALGVATLLPDAVPQRTAQHIWMAGAIGLMTMAVMTRATLGHTGRPLKAGPVTIAIYLSLVGAVILRVLAGVLQDHSLTLHAGSGLLWIGAFGGFVFAYGPMLLRERRS